MDFEMSFFQATLPIFDGKLTFGQWEWILTWKYLIFRKLWKKIMKYFHS